MPLEINESYLYDNNRNTSYINNSGNTSIQDALSARSTNASDYNSTQIINGEIVEISEGDVTLKLDNGSLLEAKLDNSMDLSVGQKLLFQVSNNGNQTALRPLYTNLNNTSAALLALREAGLNTNASNLSMVSAMMDEGMPINKQALYSMQRIISANSNADPATLVALNKLGLPITEANIEQLDNYRSFEHQIINDARGLSEGLSDMLGSSGNILNSEELMLANDILTMINDVSEEWNASLNNGSVSGNASQAVNVVTPEIITPGVPDSIPSVVERVWEITLNPDQSSDSGMNASVDLGEAEIAEDNAQMSAGNQNMNNDSKLMQSFVNDLEKLGLSSEEVNRINIGTYDADELIKFVRNVVNNELSNNNLNESQKEALARLLNNPDFKNLIGDSVLRLMQVKPEEVAKEGQIEELYKRLTEISYKSAQILNEYGHGASETMKNAQNISDNVQFMNQINQMMAYVQLPIRMAQENAHGELYVYTKKKNLKANDGNVSALLHLDMEKLGPMDVYVAMQKNKVNTNFYLQDESTLDLIEKNINLLSDRLTKKGYNMSMGVTMKSNSEPVKTVVDEILKDKSNGMIGKSLAAKMSFDIRA